MKKHLGMKSQDIVILLYIAQYCDGAFKLVDISEKLHISLSEVSESLNRSRIAKLIGKDKAVSKISLYEFLIYGLKFVFPVEPSAVTRGVPTSHSSSPLKEEIVQNTDNYVWPYSKGTKRGMGVTPLYKTVPEFATELVDLCELLALVDALRVGQIRESNLAVKFLKERIVKNA